MFGRVNMRDAQQAALGFLVSQTSIIEPQVYATRYPDIQYPSLVPVVTDGDEWARSVTFFSSDMVGQADWFDHQARDMPMADVTRDQFEVGLQMAGIGYRYTLQELMIAARTPMINLQPDRAAAARRAYEEFVDDVAIKGNAQKQWTGLINDANVTVVTLAADGTGASPYWSTKTEQQILRDFNSVLTGQWTASLQVEMADTVLLPIDSMVFLAQYRMENTTQTLLSWIMEHNIYTMQTGQPLMIRGVRGLENAGSGSVGRMIAYRRDPSIVRLHIPMPHRFLPVWQTGPMVYDIPGIFRLGGIEIRRPSAVRYADGCCP